MLDNLRPQDRVNILLFNDTVSRFDEEPVLASEENRAALREFLLKATPGGGTALGDVGLRVGRTFGSFAHLIDRAPEGGGRLMAMNL